MRTIPAGVEERAAAGCVRSVIRLANNGIDSLLRKC
jgi:hypothetical protein